jgi:hypothetical protein
MIKRLYFSKKKIIEALKKEPLKAGNWFHYSSASTRDACEVCAVGAVFRTNLVASKLAHRYDAGELIAYNYAPDFLNTRVPIHIRAVDGSGDIERQLAKGYYLRALSNFFEKSMTGKKRVTTQIRVSLVHFVKKNFPERVKLEVNL